MIKLNGHIITPTIFPDGTSQVWKLPEELITASRRTIEWDFENEAEIIHILQLTTLLNSQIGSMSDGIKLRINYLPYGRQDKIVSNSSTFALHTFIKIMDEANIDLIEVLDAHNPNVLPNREGYFILGWRNILPNDRIKEVLDTSKADIVCFPDAGASARGYDTQGLPSFSLDKKRNQSTGEIEGLECKLPLDLKGKSVIILDDICDGGKTFIEAAKLLYNMGASEVHLYTTHGLYSKGVSVLKDAGIKRVFNYKGEA